MLHLFSLFWGLLSLPAVDACELSSMPMVDVATHRHEIQLRECLERRTVWLRASPDLDVRLTRPGGTAQWVGAVRVEQSRLLSTHALGGGYELENALGEPVSLVAVYPKKGLAFFDGVSLVNELVTVEKRAIDVGRVFFAVDPDSRLVRLAVLSKGDAAF
ncbi:MAG: hypothetical protein ACPGQS_03435, partial [Bradymonadia bacterium]